MEKEIKDSLSGMIKSNNMDDIKLAIGIVTNNPEMIKDVWYNINDYITKDTVRYVEMYSKKGKSDKVYIAIENVVDKGTNYAKTYRTISYYGRRGKNLRMDDKGISHTSNWQIDGIIREKIFKGYKIINEFDKRK